jgi:hypothetical protein
VIDDCLAQAEISRAIFVGLQTCEDKNWQSIMIKKNSVVIFHVPQSGAKLLYDVLLD